MGFFEFHGSCSLHLTLPSACLLHLISKNIFPNLQLSILAALNYLVKSWASTLWSWRKEYFTIC
ncbi:hypothetical protein PVAP13_1NG167100 [Panicum virgatum]|uniref:Uncharacterized protein n=1 Tax=Panicum virgatum TaxID=38727 RepID=A0A8T0X0L1_PANVG|nr:hypothetical protein PVAP13_1NG167100 [Panicum virgatum]